MKTLEHPNQIVSTSVNPSFLRYTGYLAEKMTVLNFFGDNIPTAEKVNIATFICWATNMKFFSNC